MKKIVIIGAGFAGLSALSRISAYNKKAGLEVTLINDKPVFSFLPMLPDCLGRGISPEHLSLDPASLTRKTSFTFIKDRVAAIDLEKKEISTSALTLNYDFLVIASGTETNFYGNDRLHEYAFKLDDTADAACIRRALGEKAHSAYLIAGGGYTGIEVATNLRVYLNKKKADKRVVIIERAASILAPLPEWMKGYVAANLKKLGIEVLVNTTIEKVEAGSIRLSDGKTFSGAMLIWAAGVRTADYIQNLKVEKNNQGRIRTDEYLRVNASCFAAGDTCYFPYKNNFLRMAVQFAIMEGRCAGANIIRSLENRSLVKYRPLDLGLIIPMANNRSCGIVLGLNMRGYLATLCHYIMCIYRSYGFKNKINIIKDLIARR